MWAAAAAARCPTRGRQRARLRRLCAKHRRACHAAQFREGTGQEQPSRVSSVCSVVHLLLVEAAALMADSAAIGATEHDACAGFRGFAPAPGGTGSCACCRARRWWPARWKQAVEALLKDSGNELLLPTCSPRPSIGPRLHHNHNPVPDLKHHLHPTLHLDNGDEQLRALGR